MTAPRRVRTCLWFDTEAEEAARFYVSLLPQSRIESVSRPAPDAAVAVVEFELSGAPYMALNGGPHFTHSPAASIHVLTEDQAETDRLWARLIADGGEESMCGWLTDRFGVSWQIVPIPSVRMLEAPDRTAAGRAWEALMKMKKIDIEALEAAFGDAAP